MEFWGGEGGGESQCAPPPSVYATLNNTIHMLHKSSNCCGYPGVMMYDCNVNRGTMDNTKGL